MGGTLKRIIFAAIIAALAVPAIGKAHNWVPYDKDECGVHFLDAKSKDSVVEGRYRIFELLNLQVPERSGNKQYKSVLSNIVIDCTSRTSAVDFEIEYGKADARGALVGSRKYFDADKQWSSAKAESAQGRLIEIVCNAAN